MMPPATPMNFSQWLGGFPGGPAPLANETFFYRIPTTAWFAVESDAGLSVWVWRRWG
ncbi:hypothetical protein ACLMAJ_03710 [Nocardia sp. KC 131]|uniref:hypothetical protein n=1 Tax=Nocardia arseniciresistens TaxID=3392119 RepID=UPI00398EDCD5